jgi:Kef-type K+ transport system membrane component KefB
MTMNILLIFGIILFSGLAIGRLFEKVGIPQVVGFIVLGVLLGDSVLSLLPTSLLDSFSDLTYIALAFIGFIVGSELKYSSFKKYGKQFFIILLSEGLLAMALVTTVTTLWTGNLALGILLGALSSATAPAATVDVLWEYHSKGPLTTTILAIVALDDGLALILYGFAFAFAGVLVEGGPISFQVMLIHPFIEIFGALALGTIIAFLLDRMVKFIKIDDDILIVNVAAVLLVSGIAQYFGFSLILSSMALGLVLTNLHPDRNEKCFTKVQAFVPPIYIIFFLFVGARLQIGLLPTMGILGLLYIAGRTAGKWIGAWFGSWISGAESSVRKYLGWALFSQAGVAIGLALDIYQHFGKYGSTGQTMGHTVLNIIAATTLIVQIIGPPSVKFAIKKAKEIPQKP